MTNAALHALYLSQREREQLVNALAEMAAAKATLESSQTQGVISPVPGQGNSRPPSHAVSQEAVMTLQAGISAASAKRISQKENRLSKEEAELARKGLWDDISTGAHKFRLCDDPLQSMQSEIVTLRQELDEASNDVRDLQEELRKAKDENSDLKSQLDDSQGKVSRLESALQQQTAQSDESDSTFVEMERLMLELIHQGEEKNGCLDTQVSLLTGQLESIVSDVKMVVSQKACISRQKLRHDLGVFVRYIRDGEF